MSPNDLIQPITDPLVQLGGRVFSSVRSIFNTKISSQIRQSDYLSRDLSWILFNYRVLDQARQTHRNLFERLRFLSITANNFDEFFMIRVGSLYNYLDYGKERIDYSGLREKPFKQALMAESQAFYRAQYDTYLRELLPLMEPAGVEMVTMDSLTEEERDQVLHYFRRTIYPMLTPMLVDVYHTFPILAPKALTLGIITQSREDNKNPRRISFVQIPQNLPRFYTLEREETIAFLPLEEIIRSQVDKLFKNIEILSVTLFRLLRNGDISIEESDDIDSDFVDEVRRKLSGRKNGRVVRIEVESNHSQYLLKILREKWDLDADGVFIAPSLLDFTALSQIVSHKEFASELPPLPSPVRPLSAGDKHDEDLFDTLRSKDLLLHHPYNSMEPVLKLLEQAADDPNVLSIKMTIYRLAKNSRIISALLKAAENGKSVSVLFEVKARFDEENNIKASKLLLKAGCFVIYGVGNLKTHCKMLQIVRKDEDRVTRYVHLSTGNYNEVTSRFYTDISLLTTNEIYANDVSEFFNVITGHSLPDTYQYLITAPRELRARLIQLIRHEADNARAGKPSGICIKINSLEDEATIAELYKASQAGVPIRLIVRGICCLRPGRPGLSDNITVKSIVGDYLEHSRIFYFHNGGHPKVYGGSADVMNRSFDRRIESLFLIADPQLQAETIHILALSLQDNVNSYVMNEEGEYTKTVPVPGEEEVNLHRRFFELTAEDIFDTQLFGPADHPITFGDGGQAPAA